MFYEGGEEETPPPPYDNGLSPGYRLSVGRAGKGALGLDAHHELLHQALSGLDGLPHFCYLITYPISVIIDPYNQSTTRILERR